MLNPENTIFGLKEFSFSPKFPLNIKTFPGYLQGTK
jgi:hypothetical protein